MTLFSFKHKQIARKIDPILYNLYWKHPNNYYRKSKHIKLVREFELEKDTEAIKRSVTEKQQASAEVASKNKMALKLDDKIASLFKKVINVPGAVLSDEIRQEIQEKEDADEENNTDGFKVAKKGGFISTWKNSKGLISDMLQTVDLAFDLIEKVRKLIYWEDQKASTIVLVVLLIAFFVVTFIPLRFIIVLWLFGKFGKGSKHYRRRYIGNRECCRIELRNFFLEQNLYHFKDLFGEET